MSTSGTYTFNVTRDDIIRMAMLSIKRLDPDESPTATETQDCAKMLNMMCKQWMGRTGMAPGLKVWTRKRGHLLLSNTNQYTLGPAAQGWTNSLAVVTTTATAAAGASAVQGANIPSGVAGGYPIGVTLDSDVMFYTTISSIVGTTINLAAPLPSQASSGSYAFVYQTAAQNPVYVETALLRDEFYNDTPLRLLRTTQDYDVLPDKTDPTNEGDPTAVYWELGLTSSQLYLDVGMPQDIGKYIVLTYMEPVQDFNNPLDNPYYPQEFFLALVWGLAEQIAPMFGAAWTQKMESLKGNAYLMAGMKNAEVSTIYFMPGSEE